MGIIDMIGAGLKLAWAVITGRNAQAERVNAPDMKANAAADTAAKQADQAAKDVQAGQTGDLEQLRKDAAE